jgi:Serine/threonine protein kinase
MPLSAGTRLGPYEILSPLGAGGMGEVYRSRDTRLNRSVAVKVLPPTFAEDADRLRRFEREAQATGSLNHPNIVAVHDYGQEGTTVYVVTELLEGKSLRARLTGPPLPVRKALEYVVQVAHGLAAAHAKGITHRDIKPENLFVTNQGFVKILDFGLVKFSAVRDADANATSAQTLSMETDPGVIMGTVSYMSPEQVKGGPFDYRSDIFSLGVVLYEMLAGCRPFSGNSSIETMHAILKQEAPELPATLPQSLERIVRRCLEKNPEDRFDSASDLAFALETLVGLSSSVACPPVAPPSRRRLRYTVLAAMIFTTASLVWLFAGLQRPLERPWFHQITFRRGSISGARFVGDSKTVIYSAAWDGKGPELFSTLQGSPESRPLAISNAHIAAISRTGEMALILNPHPFMWLVPEPGTLARAPVSGGSPREIDDHVIFADWSPDGLHLAVVRVIPGGQVLEFPIGNKLYETAGQIVMPKVSPKGDLVAFAEAPLAWDNTGDVVVIDMKGKKRVLSPKYWGILGLDWSSDGSKIWFVAQNFGLECSLVTADLKGNTQVLSHLPGMFTLLDIAPDGSALLMHDSFLASMYFHRAGEKQETDLYWHDNSVVRDLSGDGRQILFSEGGGASTTDWVTFMRRTDGSPAVRLGDGLATALSPDGKWAMVNPTAERAPLVALPTHAGSAVTLAADAIRHVGGRWLKDGKRIVFVGAEPAHRLRFYVQEPGHEPRAISGENVDFDRGDDIVLSPDGSHVAASFAGQGIHLLAVDGGDPRQVPGQTAGLTPVAWCRNGELLSYRRGEIPAHIVRLDLQSGKQRPWKDLTPPDRTALTFLGTIRFTSDCETYAYSPQYDPSTLFVVSGLH